MENWDYQDEYIWNLETGKNTFKKNMYLGQKLMIIGQLIIFMNPNYKIDR